MGTARVDTIEPIQQKHMYAIKIAVAIAVGREPRTATDRAA